MIRGYIYIYIERERERDRQTDRQTERGIQTDEKDVRSTAICIPSFIQIGSSTEMSVRGLDTGT
jgi:hypothetical protein